MRLLNVRSLTFTTFPNDADRPKYVIASHRWSAGFEASFKDVQRERNTSGQGYQKVKSFAKYVRENVVSVDWLWIDTCCIDQRSSPEVSEAINSMFKWYHKAELCLAYLQDVPSPSDLSSFERSEWFARGWTLQELLAPTTVLFLSQDWQVIGYKGSKLGLTGVSTDIGSLLDSQIAEITQIPQSILEDYDQSHILSVEEKLEWMKHRQTTREEDLSYCLLGILGVSMNIRYGDGKERTRARLLKKAWSREGTPFTRSNSSVSRLGDSELSESPFASLEPPEVVLGSAGLFPLAVELAENGRKIKQLIKSSRDTPSVLDDIANELDTFAHAVNELERDRQSKTHKSVDNDVLQRCICSFDRACRRIRSAVAKLENLVKRAALHGSIASNRSEVQQLCNELDGAKTSLAFAHQMYMDARRKIDTSLVLQVLADATPDALQPPSFPNRTIVSSWQTQHNSLKGLARQKATEIEPYASMGCHEQFEHHRRRWHIRISPWFTLRVWEASLNVSLDLRTSNHVPNNALIMEACKYGDLLEVQALFRDGKATPYDYTYEYGFDFNSRTVLSAAAESGNIELCRYLIDQIGSPNTPTDTLDPLSAYAWSRRALRPEDSDAIDMYRLLLRQPEVDYDIDTIIPFRRGKIYPWWWVCPGPLCLRLIKDQFTSRLEELPLKTQMDLANVGCRHHNEILPAMFLAILGSPLVDERVANAQDSKGQTALHLIAWNTPWTGSASTWIDFITELISFGADLHHQSKDLKTPLMRILINFYNPSNEMLRWWLELLQAAKVDLDAYGRAEAIIWETSFPSGFTYDGRRITNLMTGPSVEDWSVKEFVEPWIYIFKLACPPGAWSSTQDRRVTHICWLPEVEEDEELWPWEKVRFITPFSLSEPDQRSSEMMDGTLPVQPWAVPLYLAQDDCGALSLLLHRSSRPMSRPRSVSSPSLRKEDLWHPSKLSHKHVWLPSYHLCPFDSKAKLGCKGRLDFGFSPVPMSDRRCLKGIHDYRVANLWEYYGGINTQMRRFRRRFGTVDELHALPYKAYHPEWERK